jgi:hypothetical protein
MDGQAIDGPEAEPSADPTADETPTPDPLQDARKAVEGLAERMSSDPGAPFEAKVVEALAVLQEEDLAEWTRVRDALKKAHIQIGLLDKAVEKAVAARRRAQRQAAKRAQRDHMTTGIDPKTITADAGQYVVAGGAICLVRLIDDISILAPLANFDAHIVAEEVHDDGAEQTLTFAIEGTLQSGRHLPPAHVSAERYAGMGWVPAQWGVGAIVQAGQSTKDHLRAAIQELSRDYVRRTIYTHTGWRQVEGRWLFLHADGAIGADGPVPDVYVALPGALSRFALPDPPEGEDLVQAIQASLRLLTLAPDTVSIPVYAAICRAPLGETNLSEHIEGKTGEGKTAFAALAQQHFGAGMHEKALPTGWDSSANAMEALAFHAKDVLLVVDDFAPQGSAADVQRFHRDADRLFRGQGNRSGRQRMRADTTLRPPKPSRALLLSTGEDVPRGQSLRARVLVLEHAVGTFQWDEAVSCQQDAAAGRYAQAMAGYVRWLAGRYEAVQRSLPRAMHELRAESTRSGMHKRTPEIVANLMLGLRTFITFAVEVGALSDEEAEALRTRAWVALGQAADAQARHQEASEPARRFIELLRSALIAGEAHVTKPDGTAPESAEGWGWREQTVGVGEYLHTELKAQGKRVGWLDGDDLYLEPDASYAAAQAVGHKVGDALALTPHTLRKRLKEQRLLQSTDTTRQTITVRRRLGGQDLTVLHCNPKALYPLSKSAKPDNGTHNGHNGHAGTKNCQVLLSGHGDQTDEPDKDLTTAEPLHTKDESPVVRFVRSSAEGESLFVLQNEEHTQNGANGADGRGAVVRWPPKLDNETRQSTQTTPHNLTTGDAEDEQKEADVAEQPAGADVDWEGV